MLYWYPNTLDLPGCRKKSSNLPLRGAANGVLNTSRPVQDPCSVMLKHSSIVTRAADLFFVEGVFLFARCEVGFFRQRFMMRGFPKSTSSDKTVHYNPAMRIFSIVCGRAFPFLS